MEFTPQQLGRDLFGGRFTQFQAHSLMLPLVKVSHDSTNIAAALETGHRAFHFFNDGSVRGASDITIRLEDGQELPAVLDAAALRQRHGPIYGIKIAGQVEVVLATPARIVAIQQE